MNIDEVADIIEADLICYIEEKAMKNDIKILDAKYEGLIKHIGNQSNNNLTKKFLKRSVDKQFINKLDARRDVWNFKNGLVDIRTGEFRQRTSDDYFSQVIPDNWVAKEKINMKIYNIIKKMLLHINNDDPHQFEFSCYWSGYSLTGETGEQKGRINYGLGGNGKTTELEIKEAVFPIYVTKINSKAFAEGYEKSHKYMVYFKKPFRLVFVEEVAKKFDMSTTKDVINGNKLSNEIMYGTSETFETQAKVEFTMNQLPQFPKPEKSIVRRFDMVTFNNQFVSEKDYEKIKDKKGVYVVDKNLINKFKNNVEYRMAYAHLILPYCIKYYKHGLKNTTRYEDAFADVIKESDKLNWFITNNYDITNDKNDRIHKDEFLNAYNAFSGLKFSWMNLLSDLNRLKIPYDSKARVIGGKTGQGCLIGIKLKKGNDIQTLPDDEIDAGINKEKDNLDIESDDDSDSDEESESESESDEESDEDDDSDEED